MAGKRVESAVSPAPARGAHLLDAAVEVVADRGLDALSMRVVATRAGVSLAQVQYYFASKDRLLAAAFGHVSDRFLARVARVEASGSAYEDLRAVLSCWLPLDDERARDARVWAAFTAAAVTSPVLGPLNAEVTIDILAWLGTALADAQASGAAPQLDTEIEAAVLLAVVDGLVLQALALPRRRGVALVRAGIDAQLVHLFGVARTGDN